MKAIDILTNIRGGDEDVEYLTSGLLPVNMRLYKDSMLYSRIVRYAARYIERLLMSSYEDYSPPLGMSGANAGIPWNIIAFKQNGVPVTVLNPSIKPVESDGTSIKTSNCGSLLLRTKIKVCRYNTVILSGFYPDGKKFEQTYFGQLASTIQHEIDHNNGILITDRAIP